jgi:beta-lactam-binding protein with PASTA domain
MKLKFRLPRFPKLSEIRLPTFPLDMKKLEQLDREHYRIAAYGFGALLVLMALASLTAFFLSLRGEEQTMVPDVRGMELSQALIKLQDKELYPRISLRFSDDPLERGKVVDQKPPPGSIIKAGWGKVSLSVSKGAVADKVENFVGQDLNEVKIHLQTLFASTKPLLQVREPPIYLYDKAPAGTILEQKPLPGTEIAGLTTLEFIVSRGPEKAQVRVPDLMGLSLSDVLLQVEKSDLAVKFSMRRAEGKEKPGAVVAQLPIAGSLIQASARVEATLAAPLPEKGLVAGIYSRELPAYPYPLRISLEAIAPSGDRIPLVTVNHPGGLFTAPYVLPEDSTLVLTVLDREMPPSVTVKAP